MKKSFLKNGVVQISTIIFFCYSTVTFGQEESSIQGLSKYVDPFIGTEGGGNSFVGPALPFSMVKLGPDCNEKRTNSGYHPQGNVHGFSHVHTSGTGGGPKYGNVLVAPFIGKLNLKNYSQKRENERAGLGYYSVELIPSKINVELTSTHSVGFHKYVFPESNQAGILIDLGSFLGKGHCCNEAQELIGSEVEIISNTQIEGYTKIRGGWNCGGTYTVYFSAVFDSPAYSTATWKDSTLFGDKVIQVDSGKPVGAIFYFKTSEKQVILVKVGISFISRGRARENVYREIPHWDFKQVHDNAINQWNEMLNKVLVEGGTEDQKTIFYTALYHAMMQPTNRTGENPIWNSSEPYYDDFYAIWDTFRATHPLFTLLIPDIQKDIIRALIDIYTYEGYMPDGRMGNENGRTQGGSNSDILIADAFTKGLKGINYELAYKAMIKNAERPPGGDERKEGRGGLLEYNKLGYVPTAYEPKMGVNPHFEPNLYERAGTRTLEYANCDWAIAQVAYGLGKMEDFFKYRNRSSNWTNLWRPIEHDGAIGFIWPKNKDGGWIEDFHVLKSGSWGNFFYESHSWEYSLYVPQDVKKLINYCGGKEAFVARLDTFFVKGYYNVSNEPGFLTPCLYNYASRQDKTAYRVKEIIKKYYSSSRDGIPGNDDSGSMSAWFTFHSMGFYPNAGQNVYLISSPLFSKITINLENGKKFIIKAENLNEENIYIQSAKLNNKPLNKSWFCHTDIINGGSLYLLMGDKPSEWGKNNPPPSISD